MKKIVVGILLISSLFALMACSQKEEKLVYLGIDAEILSRNYNDKILTVVGVESGKKVLQTEAKINCKDLEIGNKIFKTKNSTELEYLKFDDLKVADRIKLNVSEKELNKEHGEFLNVEQIELIEKN
ncbi:hypothetical protein [Acetivibrio ethanolgignens]|uniref:Lipoprotein n=1 Tax=Acetivibrio ethanolgignens TaxID=290052 RepID=A0A0V8QHE6_9FIRM|nr:hypothetical protein [Acetivibrio ethanolgignens]KSV59886.1 hypothetical protein ASU35_07740 [Acetivibrio ethanolgignens]